MADTERLAGDVQSGVPFQPPALGGHIVYAVELVLFSLFGWGWLALRELMGPTPVLDVAVMISVMVSAWLNLALALVLYTTERFADPARAFFSHTLAVWVLYGYGLMESSGTGALVCASGTFSLPKTYAAAYFGGLAYCQVAGAVTLAFLTFILVLAAGQARACLGPPGRWLAPSTGQGVAILVGLHLVAFVLGAPLKGGSKGAAAFAAVVVVLLFISMARLDWVRSVPAVEVCVGPSASPERDGRIQHWLELAFLLLLFLVCLSLAGSLRGGVPLSLFLVCLAVIFGQGLGAWWPGDEREEDPDPPAPQSSQAGNNLRSEMIVPGRVRTLVARRNRARQQKGW